MLCFVRTEAQLAWSTSVFCHLVSPGFLCSSVTFLAHSIFFFKSFPQLGSLYIKSFSTRGHKDNFS